jgi:hypothetical protein
VIGMRLRIFIASLVVVGAVAGLIVARRARPALPTTAQPLARPVEAFRVGPAQVVGGVAHGWAHDAAGAEHAAVSAVRATGPIAKAGFITQADLIRSIASTRFGPTLAASSATQLSKMTGELGAGNVNVADVVWAELPLTSRITTAADDRAVVDVWSVLVVGVVGKGAPRQVWRTVTVTMVWERDDWRIDGWSTAAGPTPALVTTAPISDVAAITAVLNWTAIEPEAR